MVLIKLNAPFAAVTSSDRTVGSIGLVPMINSRRRNKHWMWLVVLLAAVVSVGGGAYLCCLTFKESLYTTRGTIAYHWLIPSVIQDVPLLNRVGEPEFWYSAGDGPKPTQSEITYRTYASIADIRQSLRTHFTTAGYTVSGNTDYDYILGEYGIRIQIKSPDSGLLEIRVARIF